MPTADLGPQTSDLRLWTSDSRLRTSDLGRRTSDLRPQAAVSRAASGLLSDWRRAFSMRPKCAEAFSNLSACAGVRYASC
jgi:hypothetical protein